MTVGLLLPDLTTEFFGGAGVCAKQSSDCDAARSSASFVTGVSGSAQAFVGLLLGPILGTLSDAHGRLFFVLLTQVMNVLSAGLISLHVFLGVSLWPYLVVRVTQGLTFVALCSVIADEMPMERRAPAFALLLAMFDVTMGVVPVLVNFLGTHALMCVVCGVSLLSLALAGAYGETLPVSRRKKMAESGGAKMWRPDVALSIINSTPLFRHLAVLIFTTSFVQGGIQQVFFFYVEEYFNLTKAEAGGYLGILAMSSLFIQMFLLRPMLRLMGIARVVMFGISLTSLQYVLLVTTGSTSVLAVAMVFAGFGTVVFPCVSALKSALGPETDQGRIQGAVSAVQSFASGIAPMFYSSIYSSLVGKHPLFGRSMPSAVFFVSLVTLLLSAPSCVYMKRRLDEFDPTSTSQKWGPLPKEEEEANKLGETLLGA
jgi:DHA1 family tetracycline resistance protein-like MFS transporter